MLVQYQSSTADKQKKIYNALVEAHGLEGLTIALINSHSGGTGGDSNTIASTNALVAELASLKTEYGL